MHREIATLLALPPTTVSDFVARLQAAGLTWFLPDEVDEATLDARPFRRGTAPPAASRAMLDWPTVI